MRALWGFARLEKSYVLPGLGFLNRSGLLRGNVGITCPNCRTNFKVLQTRIRIIRLTLWLTLFAAAAAIGGWTRHAGFLMDRKISAGVVAAAICGLVVLQRYLTPYLAQIRPPRNDETLSYPLKSAYGHPDSEQRDRGL
jgi:hypothetical protein